MTTLELSLPDTLAREAREAGLLAPPRLEKLLRDALRQRAADRLFAAMDRMAALNDPAPLTSEEIQAEIAAVRRARASAHQSGLHPGASNGAVPDA